MKKIVLFVLFLISIEIFGQNRYVTMPILQTNWVNNNDRYENITVVTSGYDVNTLANLDYCLFNSFDIYNETGRIGSYSSNHGKYVSFKFIGGAGPDAVRNGMGYWCESKQMAFYSCWNDFKLSAFVLNDDKIYLVDLETDNILGTFPIATPPNMNNRESLTIMVFSSRYSSTGIHRIVIESYGSVNFYESLTDVSNISSTRVVNNQSQKIYNIRGQQINNIEKGINIVVDGDGTSKKISK